MVLNNLTKQHHAMGGGWLGLGYPRSANSWVRYIVKACRKEAEVPVHFTDDHHDFYIKRHWIVKGIDEHTLGRGGSDTTAVALISDAVPFEGMPRQRLQWLMRATLGRPATEKELTLTLAFVESASADESSRRLKWAQVVQALLSSCPYYNAMSRGLVLLLRNYKEVIIRHNKTGTDDPDFMFYQSLERMPSSLASPAVSYIHPIHLYDNWDGGPKHIVYYEDLMEKPHETIQDLGLVMNFDTEEFLANYDYHKNRSVQAYDKEEGAWTKGGTIEYAYKDDITSEQRGAWDSHLRENFPYLFEAFLKRYADE